MTDAPNDKAKPRRTSAKKAPRKAAQKTTRSTTAVSQGTEEPSDPKTEPDQFTGTDRIYAFADSLEDSAADESTDDDTAADLETWVTFRLEGETFGLPVSAAQEILRVSTITRVPHAPYTVRGIINMRGSVVPVVDLRVRLGLPETEVGPKSRILITSARGRLLGLLVDEVEQVVIIDRSGAAPAPSEVMTNQSEYIIGVYRLADRLLILLDVERILLIPKALQPEAPLPSDNQ